MIKLIRNYPYDNKYDYIKLFPTKEQQKTYFNSFDYVLIDDEDDGYIKDGESFIVEMNYDYLVSLGVNYVIFNNGFKDMYCFIYKKEYIDEYNTKLHYQIDVLNTFCFDITLQKSYVERMNCSIAEICEYDEGFDIGEHYIEKEVTALKKESNYYAMFNGFKNQEIVFTDGKISDVKSFPIATFKPLTTIDNIQYPIHFMELTNNYLEPSMAKIEIIGGNGHGSISDGLVSSNCFRFIKGMEGYAPNKYQDSGGYWTIGYGIAETGKKEIFNDLVSKQPISEEMAAKTTYENINNNYAKKVKEFCDEIGIVDQVKFDALVSLCYNTGYEFMLTLTDPMYQALRKYGTDESRLRPIWENYKVTSNGVSANGLVALRKQQCNMYFGQIYEIRPIPIIGENGKITGTVQENDGNGWLP